MPTTLSLWAVVAECLRASVAEKVVENSNIQSGIDVTMSLSRDQYRITSRRDEELTEVVEIAITILA